MRKFNYAIFGCVMLMTSNCLPLGNPATEAAYTADLMRCVDESKTLAESKACRAKVDARWSVNEDGGAPE